MVVEGGTKNEAVLCFPIERQKFNLFRSFQETRTFFSLASLEAEFPGKLGSGQFGRQMVADRSDQKK